MEKAEDTYLREANRWDQDRERMWRVGTRRAWLAAGAAGALAIVSTTAVALLTPLHRVEPFLIRVDSTTGTADVVPMYVGHADLPDTVLRHLVTEYVTLRERYVPALAEADYEQVGAYQAPMLNQAWAASWARTNPESPLNLYGQDARVTVQVRAITFLSHPASGPSLLQVRLRRATQRSAGADESVDYGIATLRVDFLAPSTEPRSRALNPLGFQVLEYRREPELPEPLHAGAVQVGSAP
jgi:type IV secretion system protein VirB8